MEIRELEEKHKAKKLGTERDTQWIILRNRVPSIRKEDGTWARS